MGPRSLLQTHIPKSMARRPASCFTRTFVTDLRVVDLSKWRRNPSRIGSDISLTPLSHFLPSTCRSAATLAAASFDTPIITASRLITIPRSLPNWLLGCSALVIGILVIGGLTRLTESGLSITEWQPLTGVLPPITQADWDVEWEKYKVSPEGVL